MFTGSGIRTWEYRFGGHHSARNRHWGLKSRWGMMTWKRGDAGNWKHGEAFWKANIVRCLRRGLSVSIVFPSSDYRYLVFGEHCHCVGLCTSHRSSSLNCSCLQVLGRRLSFPFPSELRTPHFVGQNVVGARVGFDDWGFWAELRERGAFRQNSRAKPGSGSIE